MDSQDIQRSEHIQNQFDSIKETPKERFHRARRSLLITTILTWALAHRYIQISEVAAGGTTKVVFPESSVLNVFLFCLSIYFLFTYWQLYREILSEMKEVNPGSSASQFSYMRDDLRWKTRIWLKISNNEYAHYRLPPIIWVLAVIDIVVRQLLFRQ